MSYRDIVSRPDVTAYLYVTVQGVAEAWTPVGESRSFTGHTVKPVVSSRSVKLQYGRIQPYAGIATPGSLTLDLCDVGGYLSGLLADGLETTLTADVAASDVTINVASTAGFPTAGAIHIHRERITYTGKTVASFTGCTRATSDDTYAPPHKITTPTGLESDGIEATVRVGSTPQFLEGRHLTVNLVCLDPGGFPIYDSDGVFYWPIWRGIVTACPPSPDGVSYSLQAETCERLITDDPPTAGIYGRLLTGQWAADFGSGSAQPWGLFEAPVWIPWDRRFVTINLESDAPSFPYNGKQIINLLSENHGQWRTFGQIAEAIKAGLDATTHPDIEWVVTLHCVQVYWSDNPDKLEFWLQIETGDSWPWEDGWLRLTLTHGPQDAWNQLGYIGPHEGFSWVFNGSPPISAFGYASDEMPATVLIRPEDRELPCVTKGPLTPTAGWVEVGDEIVAYAGVETTYFVDGLQGCILTGCQRGYAGTVAKEYVYRLGSETAGDLPAVKPCYCVGGGATLGSPDPDPSVWVSANKVLTGVNGEASNGSYGTWPGLGIPTELVDVDAIEALEALPPLAGAMYGKLESVRSFLSDALALEGYCLVSRPTASGCLLTPVRTGCVSAEEDVLSLTIDAAVGVKVHGGLGSIVNRVTVASPRAEARYNDGDSIARYGVRQEVSYTLPTADPVVGVASLASAARRIFRLSAGPDNLTATVSVDATGRMVSPGDVVYLVWPNPALTGYYRVIEAATPVRGRGTVEVVCQKADQWTGGLYAPTTEIQDITGNDVTVTTGHGQYFRVGATAYAFSATDWEVGNTARIDAISGDVLTLSAVAGMAIGNGLEFEDYTTKAGEVRYVWQVAATYNWGD